jgi:hypothetical protein
MTWTGQLDAGSFCGMISSEGVVTGLPGVSRFVGRGTLVAPTALYDEAGQLAGVENAQLATSSNAPRFSDCNTSEGFRGGWPAMFSSVVALS